MIFDRQTPQALPIVVRIGLAAATLAAVALSPVFIASPVAADAQYIGAPIDLALDNVELRKPLGQLAAVSGLNFVVAPGTDLSVRVTTEFDSVPWDQALVELLEDNNLGFSIEGNVLWVLGQHLEPKEPFAGTPIDLRLEQADLRDVLGDFQPHTGVEIAIDEDVVGIVDLDLTAVPWDQALDIVLRLKILDMTFEDDVLRVHRR